MAVALKASFGDSGMLQEVVFTIYMFFCSEGVALLFLGCWEISLWLLGLEHCLAIFRSLRVCLGGAWIVEVVLTQTIVFVFFPQAIWLWVKTPKRGSSRWLLHTMHTPKKIPLVGLGPLRSGGLLS